MNVKLKFIEAHLSSSICSALTKYTITISLLVQTEDQIQGHFSH